MARKKVTYTNEHRTAVEDGRLSLADVAAQLGVSRQAVSKAFKARGWLCDSQPTQSSGEILEKGDFSSVERVPVPCGMMQPPGAVSRPGEAPGASDEPPHSSWDDLSQIIRIRGVQAVLDLIERTQLLLSSDKSLSPSGLKASMSALEMAFLRAERFGLAISIPANSEAVLVLREMSSEEVEAIRQEQASATEGTDEEYNDEDGDDGHHSAEHTPVVPKQETATSIPGHARSWSDDEIRARLLGSMTTYGLARWRSFAISLNIKAGRDREAMASAIMAEAGERPEVRDAVLVELAS